MKIGKTNIIDDSAYPLRKVLKSQTTPLGSVGYQLGQRQRLTLECGHNARSNSKHRITEARCVECYRSDQIESAKRIADCTYPERKVTISRPVEPGSLAYQKGLRWQLVAECGHHMACSFEVAPTAVKCWTCHKEGRN